MTNILFSVEGINIEYIKINRINTTNIVDMIHYIQH